MFIKMPKPSRRTVAGLVTFAAMLACIPAYVSGYTVNGPSEAPTLLLGDFAIVNHAAYDLNLPYSTARLAKLGSPQRGDIVLFRVPKRNAIGLKVARDHRRKALMDQNVFKAVAGGSSDIDAVSNALNAGESVAGATVASFLIGQDIAEHLIR